MPINDDDAAGHGQGGPVKYWLKAAFLYRITELGNVPGGVVILALLAVSWAVGKFA